MFKLNTSTKLVLVLMMVVSGMMSSVTAAPPPTENCYYVDVPTYNLPVEPCYGAGDIQVSESWWCRGCYWNDLECLWNHCDRNPDCPCGYTDVTFKCCNYKECESNSDCYNSQGPGWCCDDWGTWACYPCGA